MFSQTEDGGGKAFEYQTKSELKVIDKPFKILSDKALIYYERLKDKGENIYIDKLTYEEFMLLGSDELKKRFTKLDEDKQKDKRNMELNNELEFSDETFANGEESSGGNSKIISRMKNKKVKWEDTISNRMIHWNYSSEQKAEVIKAIKANVPLPFILEYFYPDVSVERMAKERERSTGKK